MVLGLGVGAPLNAVTAFAGPGRFLVDRYLLPPLVTLGLLGLVTEIVLRSRHEPGPAGRGLTTRFADARPWWVVGLWLGMCALFMFLADRWLRHFDRGPLETLMHRVLLVRSQPVATGSRRG